MRIVIYSSTFLPNIGGLENIMSGLAAEWVTMGNSVAVYTNTLAQITQSELSYPVYRKPSLWSLYKSAKEADIFIEANLSLKTVFVGLMLRKKWVVIHHLPYNHGKTISGKLKNWLTNFSHNFCVSKYVLQSIPGKSLVIPNFYNPVFDQFTHAVKDKHTVFVGRLVSDKGVDLLIRSFKQVIATFPDAQLTIFGDGPEKQPLLKLIDSLHLANHITISNPLPPEALAQQLAHYKWLVIPSIWEEPFGLVALEGLASGCKIIAADGGGLPEAVGNFGLLFKRGNQQDLNNTLIKAYSETTLILNNNQELQTHLALHSRIVIANNYIQAFSKFLLS